MVWGNHLWHPYMVRAPPMARKIAVDGPGDHHWHDSTYAVVWGPLGYLSSSWLALVALVGTWTHCPPPSTLPHFPPAHFLHVQLVIFPNFEKPTKNPANPTTWPLVISLFTERQWTAASPVPVVTIYHREGRMDWIIKVIVSRDATLCDLDHFSKIWSPIFVHNHAKFTIFFMCRKPQITTNTKFGFWLAIIIHLIRYYLHHVILCILE